MLYGFVAGLMASNYDITDLYIDGILRIIDHDMAAAAKVLEAIDRSPPTSRSSSPFLLTLPSCRKT